jgi:hypothetical protein
MGEVYRARDTRLGREVALKILPAEVAADPARRQRFELEARAAGALNHPNIVAVYDVGTQDGVSFLVTELVEGETLREVIQRGPVAPRKVVDLAAQMASGLAAAHLAGIVHRDLKPENVMIAPGGRVKILDFGLAKQVAFAGAAPNDATRTQTDAGTVLGTVGYMAPEQVRGTAVDHRADLFSLGVILYEMLTGQRAFARDTSVETMHAILNEEPRELPEDTPPDLARIVMHCLEKDPRQRFQSAQDLAFALQSLSGSATAISKSVAAAPAVKKRRALLVAAGAACAALFVLGGFLLRSSLDRARPPFFRQVTFRHGLIRGASFAPDGRSVVYSAAWDMHALRAYLQGIGNAEAHDLDFPDGTDVASVSRRGDLALLRGVGGFMTGRVLARSSLAGEAPRDLLDNVSFVDWGPGGSMAVVRKTGGKMRLEYPIGTPLYESVFLVVPRVSPDGSQVAFFRSQDLSWFVTVVDPSGKARDLATVAKAASMYDAGLAWTPNGREIWFSGSDPAESGQIRAVDLKGNSRVVARLPGHASIDDISRDNRVLIGTENERVGILFGEGDSMPRDLSWLDASYLNDLSEDGKTVLLSETGQASGPAKSVYLRNTDGSPAIRLSSGFGGNLSRDGKWAEVLRVTGDQKMMLVPTGAGEEKPLVVPGLKGKRYGIYHWLPNGRVLLWEGQLQGRNHLYLWNLAGGDPQPFGPPLALRSLVSPDERECLIKDAEDRWAIYPITGGAARPVSGLRSDDHPVAWSSDGRSVFVIQDVPERTSFAVTRVDLASGTRSAWKQIRPAQPVGFLSNLKMTTDGRAYAYNYQSDFSTLYVVRGWK